MLNPLVLRRLFISILYCTLPSERGHRGFCPKATSTGEEEKLRASVHIRKCRVHPNARQIIRSDACSVQIRETRKKTDPPDRLLDICGNQEQSVSDYYQICPEDSKEIMLESSSVNNSSLGTVPHIIHRICSLHNICFDRNNNIHDR